MLRARHLHEHGLFDCYLAARQGEPVDPRVAEHLADCEACAGRYADLMNLMDEMRSDATDDSDAAFTPERLRAQQQQIARRIEHIGRAARVISFPKSAGGDHAIHAAFVAPHRRPRWVAAAVAAGVCAGVALGASFEWERRAWSARSVASAHQATGIPLPAVLARPAMPELPPEAIDADVTANDAFLSELEAALDRPRARALQPFDEITPHVREIRAIR